MTRRARGFARGYVAVMSLMLAGVACGFPTKIWKHQELFDAADLVVVVTASEPNRTANTDHFLPRFLQQLESELTVHAVYKGSIDTKKLSLVHFEYRDDIESTLGHGPDFVVLGTTARSVAHGPPKRPFYLMFLRRREGGKYQPVSGNNDPLPSVMRLLVFPERDPALRAAQR